MFIFHQIKAILVSIILMVFVLFPTMIIAIFFPLRRRLKIVCPVWGLSSRLLLRYGCQVHLDIKEDHRSEEYKAVPAYGLYIANHQSYIDIPLIFTKYQVPPIMKKEVLYIPILGWMAYASGAMPVSRSSNQSRKKVFIDARRRIIDQRIGVQVYPEGTRSKTAIPKEFTEVKKTLMVFAFNEKIPVIPTSIYGTRGVLTANGFVKPNRHIGIIVHKEIDPKNFESAEAFSFACWEKVREGHASIKSQLAPLNEN